MASKLNIEVPDDLYEQLRHAAAEAGQQPEEVASAWLCREGAWQRSRLPGEPDDEAWRRLLSLAGFASLDPSVGSDNDGIDQDLADEYAGDAGGAAPRGADAVPGEAATRPGASAAEGVADQPTRGTVQPPTASTLNIEVPDEVYQQLRRLADEARKLPEELVSDWVCLRAAGTRGAVPGEPDDADWHRLMSFVGCVSLGHPTGVDNESIDRDLAREYGATHEE